jgi:hypothetical protein
MRRIVTTLAFVLAFTACAPSMREKTIHATLVATNASREAFVTFDENRQLAIVENAPTREEALAQIEAYRKKRDRLVVAYEHVYRAIAIATVLQADARSLANVIAAAKILESEIKALTGGKLP